MVELQELTHNKSSIQLRQELSFQLKNGESLGGTICSHIVDRINILENITQNIAENICGIFDNLEQINKDIK